MSLSQDTRASVRATEALTAQVRRIADAVTAVSPVTTGPDWILQGTRDLSIPIPEARLLPCGLCYEEHGEEVHPHPECPIGTATADVRRVAELYERWLRAGPPPLGTSMARWWDARLLELCTAINGPGPTDPS
ncbi:hypothetical protein [Streptomyces fagopyri]